MSRKILISMLFASLTFGAGTVLAQPGPGGDHEGCGMHGGMNNEKHFERMAKDLDMTPKQVESAKKVREKFEAQSKAQHAKMKPLHDDMKKLLEADKVDLAKVRTKVQAIGAIQVELRMIHIQQHLEIQNLLTPEQRGKMKEMHKKHMEEMREHHKDGKPGHGHRAMRGR